MLLYGSKVYQLGALRLALWPQMLGATAIVLFVDYRNHKPVAKIPATAFRNLADDSSVDLRYRLRRRDTFGRSRKRPDARLAPAALAASHRRVHPTLIWVKLIKPRNAQEKSFYRRGSYSRSATTHSICSWSLSAANYSITCPASSRS